MSGGTQTQVLSIPDYVAVGAREPTPSPAWIPGQFSSLVRVGIRGPSTSADVVVVLGSANDTDPIDGGNPNQLATLYGGARVAAVPARSSGLCACAFFAFLRLWPPPGTGAPTTGLQCEMQGR